MKFHITLKEAQDQLSKESSQPFTEMMQHGTMQLEYFAPKGEDTQSPHLQDEIYVIASGSSDFIRQEEMIHCSIGDVIFVPAGMEHRFINFSADFATWVLFYGKQGGE